MLMVSELGGAAHSSCWGCTPLSTRLIEVLVCVCVCVLRINEVTSTGLDPPGWNQRRLLVIVRPPLCLLG